MPYSKYLARLPTHASAYIHDKSRSVLDSTFPSAVRQLRRLPDTRYHTIVGARTDPDQRSPSPATSPRDSSPRRRHRVPRIRSHSCHLRLPSASLINRLAVSPSPGLSERRVPGLALFPSRLRLQIPSMHGHGVAGICAAACCQKCVSRKVVSRKVDGVLAQTVVNDLQNFELCNSGSRKRRWTRGATTF